MSTGNQYRVALAALMIAASASVFAQSQRSFVASPDVYRIVAENDEYVIVEVTWKPGQRDRFHSHPAAAVYYLTDCNGRGHFPDGKTVESIRKAGTARVQGPIASHSVENIGKSDCKLIMFERKSIDDWE